MSHESLLEKNLSALSKVDRMLFERICLPVNSNHVVEEGGQRFLKVHHARVPLALSAKQLGDFEIQTEEVFVLGLGLGEMVEHLLKTHRQLKVTVYERDAWMVRLALTRNDFARELLKGRLRLVLGADVVSFLPLLVPVIEHPALAMAYAFERALLKNNQRKPLALLCTGALFVDDIAAALREEGYSVFPFEVSKLSAEELAYTLKSVQPAVVIAINYPPGLPEFLAKDKIPLLVWEIDPATDVLQRPSGSVQHAHVFTWRKSHVELFEKLGFQNVSYMPLASNPQRRMPAPKTEQDLQQYASQISFVGSSMTAQARAHQTTFLELYEKWKVSATARVEGAALLERGMALQRRDFSRFVLKEFLETELSDFVAFCRARAGVCPVMLAGEMAACEKRIAYLRALSPLKVDVWGDPGWAQWQMENVHYRGQAGHFVELNKVYSHSKINVDVGRIYQSDIVTMRVFDVLACGGFVLAEFSQDIAELFKLGHEIETFASVDELKSKVEFFLAHPASAAAITERGRRAVLERHTIQMRLHAMLKAVNY